MRTRERIIRDRFSERSCGRCGAPYAPDSVLILARRAAHWMVMVSCPHCQQRNVFVVSFSGAHDTPTLDAEALADDATVPADADLPFAPSPLSSSSSSTTAPISSARAALPSPTFSATPITAADVADMREFLASFSGDFSTLFSAPRPRRKDDPPAPPPPST